MKKLIALLAVSGLTLTGCDFATDPSPTPAPSIILPTTNPEPSKVPASPSPGKASPKPENTTKSPTTEQTLPDKASPSVSASEAGTPAVQFASRWGKAYPAVPEYMILKAGKGVCLMIDEGPDNWTQDEKTLAGIRQAVTYAGIDMSRGLEFALDAEQNYCSSLVQPV